MGSLDRGSMTQRADNSFYVSKALNMDQMDSCLQHNCQEFYEPGSHQALPNPGSGSQLIGGFLPALQLQQCSCSFHQIMAL